MKKITTLLLLLVCLNVSAQLTITPIWRFPNTATPSVNWLFVLSSGGGGNYNMSVAQFESFLNTNNVPQAANVWSAFPSPTNSITFNNRYWLLTTTNNCNITNCIGSGTGSTLVVYNTNSISINVSISFGTAGINSTNLLIINSGKRGVISWLTDGQTFTNYCNTRF